MARDSTTKDKLPVCTRCKHYWVTYDPARPHGCEAFNFKSKRSPAIEVLENSGVVCQMYTPKKGRPA